MRARLEKARRRIAKIDRHLREAAERLKSRHPNKGTGGIDAQRALLSATDDDIAFALAQLERGERDGVRATEEEREHVVEVDLDAMRVSS